MEQATPTSTWKILRQIHSSPSGSTTVINAVHVLIIKGRDQLKKAPGLGHEEYLNMPRTGTSEMIRPQLRNPTKGH